MIISFTNEFSLWIFFQGLVFKIAFAFICNSLHRVFRNVAITCILWSITSIICIYIVSPNTYIFIYICVCIYIYIYIKRVLGFPGDASGKEPACQCRDARDMGSFPGSERSLEGRHGNPFQYSCLENPMDSGRSLAGHSPWDLRRVRHLRD